MPKTWSGPVRTSVYDAPGLTAVALAASTAVVGGHASVSGQTAGLQQSPAKTTTAGPHHSTNNQNAATVAAVAAANGLLPPGMFTAAGIEPRPPTSHVAAAAGQHTAFGHTAATGLTGAATDPNSAIFQAAAAAQMQSPFLQFAFNPAVPAATQHVLPAVPSQPRTTQADMVNLQAQAGLFGLAPPPPHMAMAARPPQLAAQPALMAAYNPIAQMQHQQLLAAQQQQLLQHQLAAQRLMLTTPTPATPTHPPMGNGQPGLIGPRPPPPPPPVTQSNGVGFGAHAAVAHAAQAAAAAKRSFDQAFTVAGGHQAPSDPSKRPAYATPTISAGPTTYHSR